MSREHWSPERAVGSATEGCEGRSPHVWELRPDPAKGAEFESTLYLVGSLGAKLRHFAVLELYPPRSAERNPAPVAEHSAYLSSLSTLATSRLSTGPDETRAGGRSERRTRRRRAPGRPTAAWCERVALASAHPGYPHFYITATVGCALGRCAPRATRPHSVCGRVRCACVETTHKVIKCTTWWENP